MQKKFCSETSILPHLNQPMTTELTDTTPTFLRIIKKIILPVMVWHLTCLSESQRNDDYYPASSPSDFGHAGINHESGYHKMELDNPDAQTNFTEAYLDCSKSYAGGAMFMDKFWQDGHTEEQQVKLHFPFASAEEWKFSSWYLWLGLSMAAIDSLLLLSFISHWYLYLELWLIGLRLPNFHFHFEPQKNFGDK